MGRGHLRGYRRCFQAAVVDREGWRAGGGGGGEGGGSGGRLRGGGGGCLGLSGFGGGRGGGGLHGGVGVGSIVPLPRGGDKVGRVSGGGVRLRVGLVGVDGSGGGGGS